MPTSASTVETSSYGTYLMIGSGTSTITYTKLCDIVDFSDIFGDPEILDVTTLSDGQKRSILGIKNNDSLTFTANYIASVFSTLKGHEGSAKDYAIWFGDSSGTPDGHDGKFTFKGELSAKVVGKGVNEVRQISISIAPTTAIAFTVGT